VTFDGTHFLPKRLCPNHVAKSPAPSPKQLAKEQAVDGVETARSEPKIAKICKILNRFPSSQEDTLRAHLSQLPISRTCAQKLVLAQNPYPLGLSESLGIRLPKSPLGPAPKRTVSGHSPKMRGIKIAAAVPQVNNGKATSFDLHRSCFRHAGKP
jgi:hypothetical protein